MHFAVENVIQLIHAWILRPEQRCSDLPRFSQPAITGVSRFVTRPGKEQDLKRGVLRVHEIARSIPEMPGIPTSEISRSGDCILAAASASNGEVKNLAA